jgi:hypothetical protein
VGRKRRAGASPEVARKSSRPLAGDPEKPRLNVLDINAPCGLFQIVRELSTPGT